MPEGAASVAPPSTSAFVVALATASRLAVPIASRSEALTIFDDASTMFVSMKSVPSKLCHAETVTLPVVERAVPVPVTAVRMLDWSVASTSAVPTAASAASWSARYSADAEVRTSERIRTAPVATSVPPTRVRTVTETVACWLPTFTATPSAPLKPRPAVCARAFTIAWTDAEPIVPEVPSNPASTVPPEVAVPLTSPMPAPRPAAREKPSTWESPNERAVTFSAVAVTEVPDPTAAATMGELIASADAPATPAASATAPSETRAKAGATTVGVLLPTRVL